METSNYNYKCPHPESSQERLSSNEVHRQGQRVGDEVVPLDQRCVSLRNVYYSFEVVGVEGCDPIEREVQVVSESQKGGLFVGEELEEGLVHGDLHVVDGVGVEMVAEHVADAPLAGKFENL